MTAKTEKGQKISDSLKGRASNLKGKTYEEMYGKERSEKIKQERSEKNRKNFFYQVEENLNKMNLMLTDDDYEGPDSYHNFICLNCGEEFNTTYKKIKKAKYACNFCLYRKKEGKFVEGDFEKVGVERYELWRDVILPELVKVEKVDFIISKLKDDLNYLMDYILEDTKYLGEDATLGERLYHLVHDIGDRPLCTICDKNYVRFSGFYKGYQLTCSQKCGGKLTGKEKLSFESREKLKRNIRKAFEERGDEIIAKREETYFQREGYYHPMHNPEVIHRQQISLGAPSPLNLESIRDQISKTHKENFKDPEKKAKILEERRNTTQEKIGADHWTHTERGKEFLRNLKLEQSMPDKLRFLNNVNLEFADSIEYQNAIYYHLWRCTICENTFKTTWGDIRDGYLCPYCYPRNQGVSSYEYELREFIESYGFTTINNSKSIISPYEIDIYIPDRQIAVEINGLYWHSERLIPNKTYHLNKTKLCEEKGIQLIHIFEDEWLNKKEIVKSRIKQILNVNDATRINARDCYVKEIDPTTKNNFLNKYHLQGEDKSLIKLGAYHGNELVGVMTFSKGNISKGSRNEEGVYELNRFCTNFNYHIAGIASKLLEHFKRNYNWTRLFTYADRRWSNGDLYYNLGFEFKHETDINYWYVKSGKRIHRFRLRKRKDESKELTEWQLRYAEGYDKIWDCGNLKFELCNE